MIKRIIIIGFSGVGKTTIGKRIEKEIGLPLVHIDKYIFNPKRKRKSHNEIIEILSKICTEDKWIIDGLHYEFAEQFLIEADLVIFIDSGVITNTKNVFIRKIKHLFKPKSKITHEVIKKIHFKNTRRIWTDRKGFRRKWTNVIENYKNQFEYIKIDKATKKTSGQLIEKIKELNNK